VASGAGALGVLLAVAVVGTWVPARRYYRWRYEQQVAAYHAAGPVHDLYLARRVRYEQEVLAFAQADNLPRFRRERLAGLLAATPLQPQPIPAHEPRPPQQGRSEAAFGAYLRAQFGADNILTHCRVPVDDPRLGTPWYYPDFVYRDASGLCFDIEIDEPYVWSTGAPHHCQGQDDNRNAFFLRKHWGIIRFAEEQVVRQPLLCCQVIAEQVFALTRRHYAIRFYHERPTPVPQWDEHQARQLAARHSRTTYQRAAQLRA
jgi:hypothetical protein